MGIIWRIIRIMVILGGIGAIGYQFMTNKNSQEKPKGSVLQIVLLALPVVYGILGFFLFGGIIDASGGFLVKIAFFVSNYSIIFILIALGCAVMVQNIPILSLASVAMYGILFLTTLIGLISGGAASIIGTIIYTFIYLAGLGASAKLAYDNLLGGQ